MANKRSTFVVQNAQLDASIPAVHNRVCGILSIRTPNSFL